MKTGMGNLFILGDSYSTFEGGIPQGYATYYKGVGPYYRTKVGEAVDPKTDVCSLEQTWWYQFIQETDSNLLLNCSWSGTTVCHTGYNGVDACNKSFIARLDCLIEQGYFRENRVDTLILFGGTNDSWAKSPLGELMYSNWKKEDLYSVLPAIGYLLYRLVESLPQTKLLCVINTKLRNEIAEGFVTACEHYGVDYVILRDVDKISGHPTILGMEQIKEQILDRLACGPEREVQKL